LTFAERRLMAIDPGEARALEILPGSGEGVRQSVRLDLGVWRLDAPNHPDGNGALDEVRLETLLALRTRNRSPGRAGDLGDDAFLLVVG